MSSAALQAWDRGRRGRFEQLAGAHKAVTGSRSGRRWDTHQIVWAMTLCVAAEFQGFCRELHGEGCEALIDSAGPRADVRSALVSGLTSGRELDSKNATWATLTKDFRIFGINLRDDLKSLHGEARMSEWPDHIEMLNTARNGIAHDDGSRLQRARIMGFSAQDSRHVRSMWAKLSRFASALDGLVADSVGAMTGGTRPW